MVFAVKTSPCWYWKCKILDLVKFSHLILMENKKGDEKRFYCGKWSSVIQWLRTPWCWPCFKQWMELKIQFMSFWSHSNFSYDILNGCQQLKLVFSAAVSVGQEEESFLLKNWLKVALSLLNDFLTLPASVMLQNLWFWANLMISVRAEYISLTQSNMEDITFLHFFCYCMPWHCESTAEIPIQQFQAVTI